jgi:hypothetical protein
LAVIRHGDDERQIAKNTGKSYDLLDRWNGDGLPPERIV